MEKVTSRWNFPSRLAREKKSIVSSIVGLLRRQHLRYSRGPCCPVAKFETTTQVLRLPRSTFRKPFFTHDPTNPPRVESREQAFVSFHARPFDFILFPLFCLFYVILLFSTFRLFPSCIFVILPVRITVISELLSNLLKRHNFCLSFVTEKCLKSI